MFQNVIMEVISRIVEFAVYVVTLKDTPMLKRTIEQEIAIMPEDNNPKYFTPSISELYQAPRPKGFSKGLLSLINARIDFMKDTDQITRDQAMAVFETARTTLPDNITLN